MNSYLIYFISKIQAYGTLGLSILSFAESSFFPIPPDVLLIAMAFMNRKLAFFYAFITTAASVSGGVFGHLIGKKFGKPLLRKFFKEDKISKVDNYFEKYGGWAVGIAGFTPIPYKIFTISAGVFGVKMYIFLIASILSRGARFFLEAIIIFFFGDAAKYFISNYFEIVTIAITIVIIVVYFAWKKIKYCKRSYI